MDCAVAPGNPPPPLPDSVVDATSTVDRTTTFDLSGGGHYFVVWITGLGGYPSVHVNEVKAR